MMFTDRDWSADSKYRLVILAAAVSFAASCSPKEVVTRIPEDHARLQAIATVYAYACRELGRPPKAIEELAPILSKAQVEDPRAYLTSTRDGLPYAIVWGLDLEGRHLGSTVPLAYEQRGKNGNRLLVRCNQEVTEITSEEFARIEWPPGHEAN